MPPEAGSRRRSSRCWWPTRRWCWPTSCSTVSLPDEEFYQHILERYFPRQVVERYADRLRSAPTSARDHHDSGRQPDHQPRRYHVRLPHHGRDRRHTRSRSRVRTLWLARCSRWRASGRRVAELDNRVPVRAQSRLYLESRRLLDRATRWLLQSRRSMLDVEAEIEHFAQVKDLMHRDPADVAWR